MTDATPRVLLLYGGWEGHTPELFADFAAERLLSGYRVTRSQDLGMLQADVLSEFDLLLPIWTFGELTDLQVTAFMDAVADGLGVVNWHGAVSSFLNSRSHKFVLGGQFVGHPGDDQIAYTIRFLDNDPLVHGLEDLTVVSEQYYLLVDPAVQVLATTRIDGADFTWLAGVEMPVVWKRQWGKGRVFYCAVGHTVDIVERPAIHTLLQRAIPWAVRNSTQPYASLPR